MIRSSVKHVLQTTGQSELYWQPGFVRCESECTICTYANYDTVMRDTVTNNLYPITHRISCRDKNIIYCICCLKCNCRYIGETARELKRRISEHLSDIINQRSTPVSQHFNRYLCTVHHFSFTAVERVLNTIKRRRKENIWIDRLHTLQAEGMNSIDDDQSVKRQFLVLPISDCSTRIESICRRQLNKTSINMKTGYKKDINLTTQFRDQHFVF